MTVHPPNRRRTWSVAFLAVAAAVTAQYAATQGFSFWTLEQGYTQDVFASTDDFVRSSPVQGYLGGVVVLQNGDVIVAECETSTTRLHRFDAGSTYLEHETVLHEEAIVPTTGGCGIALHPDGFLYSNMHDGTHGVSRIHPETGASTAMGPPGNALGIAVDPVTGHLVYAGEGCKPAFASPPLPECTLIALDPASGASSPFAVFPTSIVGYVDGVAFDPSGTYLFLTNRYPTWDLVVVDRAGGIVQRVPAWSEPVGIGFHPGPPSFVVTNNQDGTLTRFDFPGGYAAPPAVRDFATGGFRGDLMQAGPDGCLYLTQNGTRYDNGDEATDDETGVRANSIVRVCGGFAPPPGITLVTDLAVDIRAPVEAEGGTQLRYTIEAANTAASAADGPVLTHALPAGLRLVSIDAPDGWACTAPPLGGSGMVECGAGSMAAGAQAVLAITALVECPVPASGAVALHAALESATPDPDPANNSASAAVGVIDPAPVITGAAAHPPASWPPNHKMVTVGVSYEVSSCAGPTVAALSVASNEPAHGAADWQVVDAHAVKLRSERRGGGSGRVYTISITATGPAGRSASKDVHVIVPHDQGRKNGHARSQGGPPAKAKGKGRKK